jgi:hypothetical protein
LSFRKRRPNRAIENYECTHKGSLHLWSPDKYQDKETRPSWVNEIIALNYAPGTAKRNEDLFPLCCIDLLGTWNRDRPPSVFGMVGPPSNVVTHPDKVTSKSVERVTNEQVDAIGTFEGRDVRFSIQVPDKLTGEKLAVIMKDNIRKILLSIGDEQTRLNRSDRKPSGIRGRVQV